MKEGKKDGGGGGGGGVRELTFLPLLHLECEVECANGEVHCLGEGLAHGAEKIEDVAALLPDEARQQLRDPREPESRRDADAILIDCFSQCTLIEIEYTVYTCRCDTTSRNYIVHVHALLLSVQNTHTHTNQR